MSEKKPDYIIEAQNATINFTTGEVTYKSDLTVSAADYKDGKRQAWKDS